MASDNPFRRIADDAPSVAERFAAAADAAPVKQQTISDYARRLQRGATSAFQGVPQQLLSMAGLGREGVESSQRASESITQRMSPQAQSLDQESFVGNPRWGQKILSAAVESAPTVAQIMAGGGPMAGALEKAGIGKAAAAGASRLGAPRVISNYAGKVAESAPLALVEGVQAGAMNATDVSAPIRSATREQLAKMPGFQSFYDETDPNIPDDARTKIARDRMADAAEREVFLKTIPMTGGVSLLTEAGMIGGLARRLRGGRQAGESFVKAVLKDAAKEGGQEVVQSGGERLIQNLVTQKYADQNQNPWENVLDEALLGGGAGALLGAAGGGVGHIASRGAEGQEPGPAKRAADAGVQSGAVAPSQPVDQPGGPTVPPGGPADVESRPVPRMAPQEESPAAPVDSPQSDFDQDAQSIFGLIARASTQDQQTNPDAAREIGEASDLVLQVVGNDAPTIGQWRDAVARQAQGARGAELAALNDLARRLDERMAESAPSIAPGAMDAIGRLSEIQRDANLAMQTADDSALAHLQRVADDAQSRVDALAEGLAEADPPVIARRIQEIDARLQSVEDPVEAANLNRIRSRLEAENAGTPEAVAPDVRRSDAGDAGRSDAAQAPDADGHGRDRISAGGRTDETPVGAEADAGDAVDAGGAGAVAPMARMMASPAGEQTDAQPQAEPQPVEQPQPTGQAEPAPRAVERMRAEPEAAGIDADQSTPGVEEAVERSTPIEPQARQPVDVAAAQSPSSPSNDRPEPTEAQKEAGNYLKPATNIGGVPVRIENEAGTRRRPEWPALKAHYGEIDRTEGNDGDKLDVYVRPGTPENFNGPVFVIDQLDQKTGDFDEHKVMLGWDNQSGAVNTYRSAFTKGWKVGPVTQMTMDEFKAWTKKGNLKQEAAQQAGGQMLGRDGLDPGSLPENAIVRDEDGNAFWVRTARNSVVRATPVEAGKRADPSMEVARRFNLRAGDMLETGEHAGPLFYRGETYNSQAGAIESGTVESEKPEPRTASSADEGKGKPVALRKGQPAWRDGLTESEPESSRADGVAEELAAQIRQESSGSDFKPSEVPAAIEQRAKDNKVDAGELRTRVVDRLRKRLSEGRMRQVEQALSEKKPAAPVAANRKPGISDFGEKIEGSRKDVWASFRDKMQQAGSVDIAAESLAKSWPVPDYQALLDSGADPWAVAFMHAARDAIPAKPRKTWKARAWADSVRMLRDMSMELADGKIDQMQVRTLLAKAAKTSRGISDIEGRVELYQLVGHGKSLAGVRVSVGTYSVYKGVEFKPPKVVWTVEKEAAATAFSNWPRELASGNTKEEALANFKERFDEIDINPPASKEATFEVYTQRGQKGYWVGKKVGRNPIFLAGPFDTIKDARAYKDAHNAELVEKLAKSKEVPSERRDTNRPRAGEDMRGGVDVTPQMFGDAFGFRGVQFGNYMEQARRQQDLNNAYDALMDMAAVLGVAPKALSLNGELGLAFGARGKGGKNAAMAHYEPGQVVINLTKREGAGSLGHEWWHALDNYFSRMRSKADDMMTGALDVSLAVRGSPFQHRGEVRKEMVEAFGAVMRAINETAIKARSAKLDAKRSKDYWTTGDEMSARAFESYLIAKLQDHGASNDYLANIVDEATWDALSKLGVEMEESYPYPTAGEAPVIRAAFDHFFQTVETRETDKGLALFEPTAQYRVDETQASLFDDVPEPQGKGRRTGPDGPRIRGDVQSAAALSDTPTPAGEYFVRTIVGTEVNRKLGASVINTHADAARATKYLYRNAVERFDGIVTDKNGRPLAVVGGFKGALTQTSAYPSTLVGEAVRVPGAARIWFSHNHPSGSAELSGADRAMNATLTRAFHGSGIEPMGLLAVAGDVYAFQAASAGGAVTGESWLPIGSAAGQKEVPVVERLIATDKNPGRQISSPAIALETGKLFYGRTKAPGLMLLNSQNHVVAWVPMPPSLFGRLRGTGGLQSLYRSISESTVDASIIVHGGELDAMPSVDGVPVVENIGAALAQVEVRPLDAINVVTGESRAERAGAMMASGPVFSRGARRGQMTTVHVQSIANAVRAQWENAPQVTAVGSMEDARVPSAVREEYQRQQAGGAIGSPQGFIHQGHVYLVADSLSSPREVLTTLAHESLGHFGLRGTFGESLNAVLDKVIEGRPQEVESKRLKYGLADTVDGRRTAAEELLADLAQTQPKLSIVRAAAAAIRSWLRRFMPNLRMSNDEIISNFILPARRWVTHKDQSSVTTNGVRFTLGRGPRWYSALARGVANGPGRADAANWKSFIKNMKGVKPEEIEWSGVNEWLDLQDGKIAKADVQAFLDANGVQVGELILGGEGIYESTADVEAQPRIDETAEFNAYRVPGFADAYREILLTSPMPTAELTEEERDEIRQRIDAETDEQYAELNAALEGEQDLDTRRRIERQMDDISREADEAYEDAIREEEERRASEGFESDHWKTRNVIAHTRVDERADADGNRVLFVNEIQSDWGQEGKQRGFVGDMIPQNTTFEVVDTLDEFPTRRAAEEWIASHPGPAPDEGMESRMTIAESERDGAPVFTVQEEQRSAVAEAPRRSGVRRGPFVTRTESWVGLALKRIARYAVDNGIDRVAIASGTQAADMFDLSNFVDSVSYVSFGDKYKLSASSRGGNPFSDRNTFSSEELDGVVGKEVADRIRSGAGRDDKESGMKVLEGIDLQVGGEGMRAFYDRIVPNVLKSVLKGMGGKVTTIQMERTDPARYEIRATGNGWDVFLDGEPANQFEGSEIIRGNGAFRTKRDAQAWIDSETGYGGERVGFEITEQMRDTIRDGLPMFKRSEDRPRTVGQAATEVLRGYTGLHSIANRLRDLRGIGLQALGRRQIAEAYAEDIPQLARYSDLVQSMAAEKNEAGAEADTVARDWGKLKDERQLADVMHDATLAGFDPDTDTAIEPDQIALQRRFESLSTQAKSIYRKARDMYRDQYAKIRHEIRERIIRSVPEHMGRAELLTRLDDSVFKALSGVYFPLARFGDYVVTVRSSNEGFQTVVSRAETLNEAEALQRSLRAQFPASDGFKVSKITKAKEFSAVRDAAGRGFMSDLHDILEKAQASEELIDAVNQLYLTGLPDLSWTKHGIHRKGTPGFSQDARRAFAQNMFHGARYLAKLKYSDQLTDELDAMQKHVDSKRDDESFDSVTAQQVVDEMVKRQEVLLNPRTASWSTGLTSMGFVYYLGFAPAAAIVNLTQNGLVAFPLMGAKWGFRRSMTEMIRSSRETAQAMNNLQNSKLLSIDEKNAIRQAIADGTIDITLAQELAGIAQGEDSKVSWKVRPVMNMASFMFHHAERFNRQSTFLASYRLAKGRGLSNEQAYAQAKDMTMRSHFDYGAENRPRIMQGDFARVVLLFKQFAQNMMWTMSRNVYRAFKGDREALRAAAGLITMHALAAGMFGLSSAVEMLMDVASWLGSSDDDPWDAERALRVYMAEALGPRAGAAVAHGLSRLTPWDISGRVGLDNLIIPDVREGLEGEPWANAAAAAALGPVANMWLIGPAKGANLMSEGHWLRGLEAITPLSIRGTLKALRYGNEGVLTKDGRIILDHVSPLEWLGQVAGFTPSRVADSGRERSATFRLDRQLKERRQELLRDYGSAIRARDAQAINRMREAVIRFNLANPDRVITGANIMQSIRARMLREAETERGIYMPRKQRRLIEEGAFAIN